MSGQVGLLELSVGSVLRLDGVEWTVAAIQAQYGRVLLGTGEQERWQSIRWLSHHRDCQSVPAETEQGLGLVRQPASMDDLSDHQREVVRLRVAHLLETETGFRGGDPLRPEPGEPRPAYDPQSTTLGQRRRAKVAELRELGSDEAALLGLGRVSERTLKRMAAAWRENGPIGCVDGRWLRAGGGHSSITEEVGVTWGIGFALMEHTQVDPNTARVVNPNLSGYLVPVCVDVPSVEAFFVDRPDLGSDALHARGFGETPATGVPAAISNAIFHATGRRLRDVPFTQDKLL